MILDGSRLGVIPFYILVLALYVGSFAVPQVNLLTPQNDQKTLDLTPTFTWHSEGSSAITQNLYVDTDSDPYNGGVQYNPGTDQTYTLTTDLEPSTLYYWGVAVTDNSGTTQSIVKSFSSIAENQGGFIGTENLVSTTEKDVRSVKTADIDGDGDIDIIASSWDNNQVYWYENDGIGNFTNHLVTTNNRRGVIRVADMDRDGDFDFVLASSRNRMVYWYENDGDESFTERTIPNTVGDISSITIVDLDSDGDMDITSISDPYTTRGSTTWYENDGDENFTEHTIITEILDPGSVYTIDIEGDGDIDILTALGDGGFTNYSTPDGHNEIALYRNDGDENFTEQIIRINARNAKSVYAVDMDSDGDIDILSSYGTTVSWYENDGNLNFTEHIIGTEVFTPLTISAGDMDGDGDIDVISGVFWYENLGSTHFIRRSISSYNKTVYDVNPIDVDNDGDLDIVFAFYGDFNLTWYENVNPQLSSVSTQSASTLYGETAVGNGTIIEINGHIESHGVCWNTTSNPTILDNVTNEGAATTTGAFTSRMTNLTPGVRYYVRAYVTNSEGTTYGNELHFTPQVPLSVDLISPQNNSSSINQNPTFLWESDGSGEMHNTVFIDTDRDPFTGGNMFNVGALKSYTHTAHLTPGITYYWGVSVTDDNGTLQSVVRSYTSIEGNRGKSFNSEIVVSDTALGIQDIYTIDLDSDGDMDILSASWREDKISWHENNGSGMFTEHVVSMSVDYVKSIYGEDVDGDGDVDILSASMNDDKISWFENNGNQSFTEHVVSTTADNAKDVRAADMDGDGDMDILSVANTSFDVNEVSWYENDGNENFTEHLISTSIYGAVFVDVVDLNSDGSVDVLIGASPKYGSDKMYWFKNDGSEQFTRYKLPSSYSRGGGKSIYITDLDGDSDIDIISIESFDRNIIWYENDGNENFVEHTVSTEVVGPQLVYAADFDGDGDSDIISGSTTDNQIVWHENDGNENFTTHTITTSTIGAFSVIAVDIDGDGDLDVLSAADDFYKGSEISWYENVTPIVPIVETQSVSGISATTVVGNGSITDIGNTGSIIAHGFCWSTVPNPTTSNDTTDNGAIANTGTFSSNITTLKAHTTYYIRAYVTTDKNNTVYGGELTFTTLNTPPSFTMADKKEINEDTSLEILLEHTDASDDDGDNLTLEVEAGNNYTFEGTTITPHHNVTGEMLVKLRVTDGIVYTASVFMTVTVNAVNDAPEITATTVPEAQEDTEFTFDLSMLTVTDVDTDQNDLSIKVLPGNDYTVTSVSSIVPSLNHTTDLSVNVVVSDGLVDSDPVVMTVKIKAVNDVPVITVTTVPEVQEDTDFTFDLSMLTVTDIDNAQNDLSIKVLPGNDYTVTSASSIAPSLNHTTDLSVNIVVSDGLVDSDPVVMTVKIKAVNDAPVITVTTVPEAQEDTEFTFDLSMLTVTDVDTDQNDLSIKVLPGNDYTMTSVSSIVPSLNHTTDLSVNVVVSDGLVDSDPVVMTVEIKAANDAPVITATTVPEAQEDTEFTFDLSMLTVTDVDTDQNDLSIKVFPGNDYTVTSASSILPSLNHTTDLSVNVVVSDGLVDSDPVVMTVKIKAVNDAPVITVTTVPEAQEDTDFTLNLSMLTVTDVDNAQGDLSVKVLPGNNYSLTGIASILPASNHTTDLSVNVVVSDGLVDSDPVVMTVKIKAVNDAPKIISITPQTIRENASLAITLDMVSVSDVDNPISDMKIVIDSGGDYTVSGATVTPVTSFSGVLTIPIAVFDGILESDKSSMKITVEPIPESSSEEHSLSSSSNISSDSISESSQGESSSVLSSQEVVASSSSVAVSSDETNSSSTLTISSHSVLLSSILLSSTVSSNSNGVSSQGEPINISSSQDLVISSSTVIGSSDVRLLIEYGDNYNLYTQTRLYNNVYADFEPLHAPEVSTNYKIFTMYGSLISSGDVSEGLIELPRNLPSGVIVIHFYQ
ncbi:MAG: FG-GAP-like repeat-containing protein [Fibrobacterales bacterium]